MSLEINIDGLPNSVNKFTNEQLVKCFVVLNKNNQIMTIKIKESHLPVECAKILTWTFFDSMGNIPGVVDVKRSIVKMMIYSKTHKDFKSIVEKKEELQRNKNNSLIEKLKADIETLNGSYVTNDTNDINDANDAKKQILIKEKIIEKLLATNENKNSVGKLDPNQIGAIGKRIFEILKKGDNNDNTKDLYNEFKYANGEKRPTQDEKDNYEENSFKKDVHQFTESDRTRVFKNNNAQWKSQHDHKKYNHNLDNKHNSNDDQEKRAQHSKPKAGLYVLPKINNNQYEKTEKQTSKYCVNYDSSTQYQPSISPTSPMSQYNENKKKNDDKFISLSQIEKEKNEDKEKELDFGKMNFPELSIQTTKTIKNTTTVTMSSMKKIGVVKIFSDISNTNWDNDLADDNLDDNHQINNDHDNYDGNCARKMTFSEIIKMNKNSNQHSTKAKNVGLDNEDIKNIKNIKEDYEDDEDNKDNEDNEDVEDDWENVNISEIKINFAEPDKTFKGVNLRENKNLSWNLNDDHATDSFGNKRTDLCRDYNNFGAHVVNNKNEFNKSIFGKPLLVGNHNKDFFDEYQENYLDHDLDNGDGYTYTDSERDSYDLDSKDNNSDDPYDDY